mmetsp:Transcript_153770/g.267996  ORF Transcript_153770/g.267996 Transcript_153770/m.267996 type:complete len:87 (-) Transcript_153770:55-315(-)
MPSTVHTVLDVEKLAKNINLLKNKIAAHLSHVPPLRSCFFIKTLLKPTVDLALPETILLHVLLQGATALFQAGNASCKASNFVEEL